MYCSTTFAGKEYIILFEDGEYEKISKIATNWNWNQIRAIKEIFERGTIELMGEVKQIEEHDSERGTNGKEETGDNG